MIVVVFGFYNDMYTNSICGILLAFTLPIPSTLIYNRNSYYVGDRYEGDELYDTLVPMHWLWILAFTSWKWCVCTFFSLFFCTQNIVFFGNFFKGFMYGQLYQIKYLLLVYI